MAIVGSVFVILAAVCASANLWLYISTGNTRSTKETLFAACFPFIVILFPKHPNQEVQTKAKTRAKQFVLFVIMGTLFFAVGQWLKGEF